MEDNTQCPCPNLDCPNHNDCKSCISRHLRLGFLNYCAFHTVLPTLMQVTESDPNSTIAKKLMDDHINPQLQAYEKLMKTHGLSRERQKGLLAKIKEYSSH